MQKITFLLAILVLCLSSALAYSKDKVLKVGIAGAFSGQFASLGIPSRAAAQMAVDELNKQGGINGKKLLAVTADDKCLPDEASKAAEKLSASGITVAFGHICSGAAIAAKAVFTRARISIFSPAASNPAFTDQDGEFAMRTALRDDNEAKFIGDFVARKWRGKSIVVVDDGSILGGVIAYGAEAQINASGSKVAAHLNYDAEKKDFSAILYKLKEVNASAVVVGGYWPEAAVLAKAMQVKGLSTKMVGGDAFQDEGFARVAGKAARNVYFVGAADPQKLPEAAKLRAALKSKGLWPNQYAFRIYAAIQAWASAAKATGSTDGKTILKWLRDGNPVSTVMGQISFDAKGDIKQQMFQIFTFSGGRIVEQMS